MLPICGMTELYVYVALVVLISELYFWYLLRSQSQFVPVFTFSAFKRLKVVIVLLLIFSDWNLITCLNSIKFKISHINLEVIAKKS